MLGYYYPAVSWTSAACDPAPICGGRKTSYPRDGCSLPSHNREILLVQTIQPLLNYSKNLFVHNEDSCNLENLWRQYAWSLLNPLPSTDTTPRVPDPVSYPLAQSEAPESGLKSQFNFLRAQVVARMRCLRSWCMVVRKLEWWIIDHVSG
jgi:hypothetical protein